MTTLAMSGLTPLQALQVLFQYLYEFVDAKLDRMADKRASRGIWLLSSFGIDPKRSIDAQELDIGDGWRNCALAQIYGSYGRGRQIIRRSRNSRIFAPARNGFIGTPLIGTHRLNSAWRRQLAAL